MFHCFVLENFAKFLIEAVTFHCCCGLAAVREGGVCVGTAVYGAAGIGHRLGATACHNAQHSGHHGQHENETRNGNGNGKRALRYAQGILQSL